MAKSLEQMLENLTEKTDDQYKDLDKRLDNIEKVLIAQEINVKEHMRRSDNLEKLVNTLQIKEIAPLTKHMNMVEGAFKLVGLVALVLTIITGLGKLLGLV